MDKNDIAQEYLKTEIEKFCKIKNIPIIKDKIQSQYLPEIKDFITIRLKKDRAITKRIEEENRLSIKLSIKEALEPFLSKINTNSTITGGFKDGHT